MMKVACVLYRFDVDWLKDPRLRNRHKINDCGLAPEEVKYIKGIHERNKSLAAKPSKLDRSALQEAYGEDSVVDVALEGAKCVCESLHVAVSLTDLYTNYLTRLY